MSNLKLIVISAALVLATIKVNASMEIKVPKPTPSRPVVKPLKPWQKSKTQLAREYMESLSEDERQDVIALNECNLNYRTGGQDENEYCQY